MVKDNISNASLYYGLGKRIETGLKYLENTELDSLESGKYEIEGTDIFAIVSEYNTKSFDETKTENHVRYIDIQYIQKGEEYIGYVPFKDQEVVVPYNTEKDVAFYNCNTVLTLYTKSDFAIFYPHDLHQPGVEVDSPQSVKKVVIKVKMD